MPKGNCRFTGSGGDYFPTVLIHLIILSTITFGIYWPWAWVRALKLKASHTIINGKTVTFTGTGQDLFVLCLVQGLLTVITLGIYAPWALCRFLRWRAENTLVGDNPSEFKGSGVSLLVLTIIHFLLLPMITFGVYALLGYGFFRFYAWKEENTRYGGEDTSFGGTYKSFLKPHLLGGLLNAVTFNLAMPWVLCMLFRWQIGGLAVGNPGEVEHFPPFKVNVLLVIVFVLIGLIPAFAIGIPLYQLYQMSQQHVLNIPGLKDEAGRFEKVKPKKTPSGNQVRMPIEKKQVPGKKESAKEIPAGDKPMQKRAEKQKKGESAQAEEKKIDYGKEINRLNRLVKESENDSDLYYNRARLYAAKGDVAKAIEDYGQAVEIEPEHADAYYNRGLLYAGMERFEMALKDFNKALELDPKAYDALCNRGNVYYELEKYESAIADYTQALELQPQDADILQNRSRAYEASGKPAKAEADREKAARLRRKAEDGRQRTEDGGQRAEDRGQRTEDGRRKAPGSDPSSWVEWRKDLDGVEMPDRSASGRIHGDEFMATSAKISGGSILTIRDGEDFFPDHAVKVFIFLEKGESIEGEKFEVNPESGFGSPHIHLQWRPEGKKVPETKIYMKNYSMRLEFGSKKEGRIPGKIYLCLPDESKSFVAGSFHAEM